MASIRCMNIETASGEFVLVALPPAHLDSLYRKLRSCAGDLLVVNGGHQAWECSFAGKPADIIIVDIALAAGAWWSALLQRLCGLKPAPRLFVLRDGFDPPLCGEVVSRGGYRAIDPPHRWRPLAKVLAANSGSAGPLALSVDRSRPANLYPAA